MTVRLSAIRTGLSFTDSGIIDDNIGNKQGSDTDCATKELGGVRVVSIAEFDRLIKSSSDGICFVMDYSGTDKLSIRIANRLHRIMEVSSAGRKILTNGLADYMYEVCSKHNRIRKYLNKRKINHLYFISKHDQDLLFQNMVPKWDAGRQQFYQNRFDDVVKVGDLLLDDDSKETYKEYLRTYCENKVYSREHILFRYKYFYGSNDKEEIYRHLNDEVWVNCGAGRGETVFAYISEYFNYKKIYAIDADGEELKTFRKDIAFLPAFKRDRVSIIEKRIDSSADLISIIGEDKLTLLNADIEDAELHLLHGLIDIIKKDRPVIAICVYHSMEQSLDIPLYLGSELDEYVFLLRKYVSSATCKKRNNELVFYAIPRERR